MTYNLKIGGRQLEILKILVSKPETSITEIQQKLGIDKTQYVSSSIHGLQKQGLVTILNSTKSEKNRTISLWGLSEEGVAYTLIVDDINASWTEILPNYRKYYDFVDWLYELVTIIKEYDIPQSEVKLRKFVFTVFELERSHIDYGDRLHMLEALVKKKFYNHIKGGKNKRRFLVKIQGVFNKASEDLKEEADLYFPSSV